MPTPVFPSIKQFSPLGGYNTAAFAFSIGLFKLILFFNSSSNLEFAVLVFLELSSFDGVYKTVKMDDKRYTKWGWEISPEAFLNGLRMLKDSYGDIKMYVTENGLGDEDPIIDDEIVDVPRIKFIEDHLRAIKKAIAEGINLKGYYAWSVIDLLSWLNGFKKQYGFIYVDHKNNLKRKKKLSFYWYKKVIEERGENRRSFTKSMDWR